MSCTDQRVSQKIPMFGSLHNMLLIVYPLLNENRKALRQQATVLFLGLYTSSLVQPPQPDISSMHYPAKKCEGWENTTTFFIR